MSLRDRPDNLLITSLLVWSQQRNSCLCLYFLDSFSKLSVFILVCILQNKFIGVTTVNKIILRLQGSSSIIHNQYIALCAHHPVKSSWKDVLYLLFKISYLFIYLFIFREGEGREKERERNINVRLPLMCPLLGTWPATQACALTGNRTGDPLVCRLPLKPLSHTSQGEKIYFTYFTHTYTFAKFLWNKEIWF